MATKPTLVTYNKTAWNSTTSPKTSGTITVSPGDILTVVAKAEGNSAVFADPVVTGLTFTARESIDLSSNVEVASWTSTIPGGTTSIDISITNTGSSIFWGFEWWVHRGSDGVGNTAKANSASGTAPSIAITTAGDNSAIICSGGDWDAGATTGKTWRTANVTPSAGNGMENDATQTAGRYTTYSCNYDDAGSAGSKTVGMSAPNQKPAFVAIEIKGAAASGAVTADAGNAAATGTAYDPTVALAAAPEIGHAAGVGTAYDAEVATAAATQADAGHAAGVGSAYDPGVTTTVSPDAGHAAGTGTAYSPSIPLEHTDADGGSGSGTGTAYDATVVLAAAPPADSVAGVGTAYSPTVETVEFEPPDEDLNIPVPVRVEWLLDGSWVDLTDKTYTRQSIEITRGIPDEGTRADPTACTYQINNRDGQFSGRNPLSPYFDSLGRNIPSRVVIDVASDNFDRTTANGWGRSSSRYDWSILSGASSVFSTDSTGYGLIAAAAENTNYTISLGIDTADLELYFTFKPGVVATGGQYYFDAFLRHDGTNYYAARLLMQTDGTINFQIWDTLHDVALTFIDGILDYGTTTEIGVRFKVNGRTMAAKIWDVANGEPAAWTLHAADVEDDALLDSGSAGFRLIVPTASTLTLPKTFRFGNVDLVHYRAATEVAASPNRWDVSGRDVWVPVQSAGIARRLGQGRVLMSALTRSNSGRADETILSGLDPLYPLDHWPLEGPSTDATFANLVPGGQPMRIRGTADPESLPTLGGSDPLPKFTSGSYAEGRLRAYTDVGAWSATSVTFVDAALVSRTCTMSFDLVPNGDPSTTLNQVRVHVDLDVGELQYLERVGSTTTTVLFQSLNTEDRAQIRGNYVYTAFCIDSTDTVWLHCYWYYNGIQYGYFIFDSMANPYKPARTMYVGSALDGDEGGYGHAAFYVGNVTLYNTSNFNTEALWGYVGEPAAQRVERLCREEGVPLIMVAGAEESMPMGTQKSGPLLDLLDEAVLADMGLLFEARDELAFVYLARRMRYGTSVVLPLDYETRGHVSPPLEPLPDDFAVINDLTVQRIDGSFARYVLTEGRMSVQPPPLGVGTYANSRQVSLASDGLCAGRASFEVFLSTVDEERYPTIHIDMVAAIAAGEAEVVAAAKRLDSGDRLQITSLPAWQPPGDLNQIALGFNETLGDGGQAGYAWDILVQARPYGVWGQIGVVQTQAATPGPTESVRMDTAGSRTSGSFIAGTNTNLTVVVYAGPLWGLTADTRMDFPFDIIVSGIILRVTGIAGGSSPQTFTISTTLPQGSGYAKTIPSGSEIKLAYPARFGL